MIWSLSDQRLRWNEIVAKKRRTAPLQVEELMSSVLERQRQADEEVRRVLDECVEVVEARGMCRCLLYVRTDAHRRF